MLGVGGREQVRDKPVYPVAFCMKVVVAVFESYILINQEKSRHTNGEARDVEEGEGLMAPEAAEGELDIIFEHYKPWLKWN